MTLMRHAGLATWLLSRGRTDEAVRLAQRGRELDPLAVSGAEYRVDSVSIASLRGGYPRVAQRTGGATGKLYLPLT